MINEMSLVTLSTKRFSKFEAKINKKWYTWTLIAHANKFKDITIMTHRKGHQEDAHAIILTSICSFTSYFQLSIHTIQTLTMKDLCEKFYKSNIQAMTSKRVVDP